MPCVIRKWQSVAPPLRRSSSSLILPRRPFESHLRDQHGIWAPAPTGSVPLEEDRGVQMNPALKGQRVSTGETPWGRRALSSSKEEGIAGSAVAPRGGIPPLADGVYVDTRERHHRAGQRAERSRTVCLDVSLSLANFRCVQTNSFENERLQRGLVYSIAFVDVDGANRVAFQSRVEKRLWILNLSAFWERQPHGFLERVSDTDYSVVGPDGDSRRVAGFPPLHFFDHGRVCSLDHISQMR